MLDVALFFSHHAERIDSARFWKTMESLKYSTIARSILWATVRYCEINVATIHGICRTCPEQEEMILDDLENGGWLGKIDKNVREEGWYEYNRQVLITCGGKTHYWRYMLLWKMKMHIKSLFPSRETLEKQYPHVEKSAYLIPFVWLHRLVYRGSRAIRNGTLTSYIVTNEKNISASESWICCKSVQKQRVTKAAHRRKG